MQPEFSHIEPLQDLPPTGRTVRLAASAEACAALARRFGIPAVHALVAELELRPLGAGVVLAQGRMEAEVVQHCVVTLEPFMQRIAEAVLLRILPAGAVLSDDPEGPDEVVAEEGAVDLGEAVAEQLSLALDPYPRAPGASLAAVLDTLPGAVPAPPHPFAVLERLKRTE